MPKTVTIITDWPAEQRLALVKKFAPGTRVTEANGHYNDQEAFYTVRVVEDSADGSETKGNEYNYKLTVEVCRKELGPPPYEMQPN